jgi:hypothetical protein
MPIELLTRKISRVAIIDDERESRRSYGYTISNADLEPVPQDGPLGTLDEYLCNSNIQASADAALCDFHLSARAYASFSGAGLVAKLYKSSFPALLCTRYEKAQIEHIRPLRRWVPVLITPSELNVETLRIGLEECIYELTKGFRANRRPWRTQVHFLSKDEDLKDTFFAEIPGWALNDVVRVCLDDLPPAVAKKVQEDFRCYAYANLGAESAEELYLCDWEIVG